MQYLLTEEEFAKLVPKEEKRDLLVALGVARERILSHSNFPCIHNEYKQNEYCDMCPCRVRHDMPDICLLEKNYSR